MTLELRNRRAAAYSARCRRLRRERIARQEAVARRLLMIGVVMLATARTVQVLMVGGVRRMLKIEANKGCVSVDLDGRADDVMNEFLCATLGVYNEWKATDEKLGDRFKALVKKAANSETGFWSIEAEEVSSTRVTTAIHRPRKEGESGDEK